MSAKKPKSAHAAPPPLHKPPVLRIRARAAPTSTRPAPATAAAAAVHSAPSSSPQKTKARGTAAAATAAAAPVRKATTRAEQPTVESTPPAAAPIDSASWYSAVHKAAEQLRAKHAPTTKQPAAEEEKEQTYEQDQYDEEDGAPTRAQQQQRSNPSRDADAGAASNSSKKKKKSLRVSYSDEVQFAQALSADAEPEGEGGDAGFRLPITEAMRRDSDGGGAPTSRTAARNASAGGANAKPPMYKLRYGQTDKSAVAEDIHEEDENSSPARRKKSSKQPLHKPTLSDEPTLGAARRRAAMEALTNPPVSRSSRSGMPLSPIASSDAGNASSSSSRGSSTRSSLANSASSRSQRASASFDALSSPPQRSAREQHHPHESDQTVEFNTAQMQQLNMSGTVDIFSSGDHALRQSYPLGDSASFMPAFAPASAAAAAASPFSSSLLRAPASASASGQSSVRSSFASDLPPSTSSSLRASSASEMIRRFREAPPRSREQRLLDEQNAANNSVSASASSVSASVAAATPAPAPVASSSAASRNIPWWMAEALASPFVSTASDRGASEVSPRRSLALSTVTDASSQSSSQAASVSASGMREKQQQQQHSQPQFVGESFNPRTNSILDASASSFSGSVHRSTESDLGGSSTNFSDSTASFARHASILDSPPPAASAAAVAATAPAVNSANASTSDPFDDRADAGEEQPMLKTSDFSDFDRRSNSSKRGGSNSNSGSMSLFEAARRSREQQQQGGSNAPMYDSGDDETAFLHSHNGRNNRGGGNDDDNDEARPLDDEDEEDADRLRSSRSGGGGSSASHGGGGLLDQTLASHIHANMALTAAISPPPAVAAQPGGDIAAATTAAGIKALPPLISAHDSSPQISSRMAASQKAPAELSAFERRFMAPPSAESSNHSSAAFKQPPSSSSSAAKNLSSNPDEERIQSPDTQQIQDLSRFVRKSGTGSALASHSHSRSSPGDTSPHGHGHDDDDTHPVSANRSRSNSDVQARDHSNRRRRRDDGDDDDVSRSGQQHHQLSKSLDAGDDNDQQSPPVDQSIEEDISVDDGGSGINVANSNDLRASVRSSVSVSDGDQLASPRKPHDEHQQHSGNMTPRTPQDTSFRSQHTEREEEEEEDEPVLLASPPVAAASKTATMGVAAKGLPAATVSGASLSPPKEVLEEIPSGGSGAGSSAAPSDSEDSSSEPASAPQSVLASVHMLKPLRGHRSGVASIGSAATLEKDSTLTVATSIGTAASTAVAKTTAPAFTSPPPTAEPLPPPPAFTGADARCCDICHHKCSSSEGDLELVWCYECKMKLCDSSSHASSAALDSFDALLTPPLPNKSCHWDLHGAGKFFASHRVVKLALVTSDGNDEKENAQPAAAKVLSPDLVLLKPPSLQVGGRSSSTPSPQPLGGTSGSTPAAPPSRTISAALAPRDGFKLVDENLKTFAHVFGSAAAASSSSSSSSSLNGSPLHGTAGGLAASSRAHSALGFSSQSEREKEIAREKEHAAERDRDRGDDSFRSFGSVEEEVGTGSAAASPRAGATSGAASGNSSATELTPRERRHRRQGSSTGGSGSSSLAHTQRRARLLGMTPSPPISPVAGLLRNSTSIDLTGVADGQVVKAAEVIETEIALQKPPLPSSLVPLSSHRSSVHEDEIAEEEDFEDDEADDDGEPASAKVAQQAPSVNIVAAAKSQQQSLPPLQQLKSQPQREEDNEDERDSTSGLNDSFIDRLLTQHHAEAQKEQSAATSNKIASSATAALPAASSTRADSLPVSSYREASRARALLAAGVSAGADASSSPPAVVCALCDEACPSSGVWCPSCNFFLCGAEHSNCDRDLHSQSAKMKLHVREPAANKIRRDATEAAAIAEAKEAEDPDGVSVFGRVAKLGGNNKNPQLAALPPLPFLRSTQAKSELAEVAPPQQQPQQQQQPLRGNALHHSFSFTATPTALAEQQQQQQGGRASSSSLAMLPEDHDGDAMRDATDGEAMPDNLSPPSVSSMAMMATPASPSASPSPMPPRTGSAFLSFPLPADFGVERPRSAAWKTVSDAIPTVATTSATELAPAAGRAIEAPPATSAAAPFGSSSSSPPSLDDPKASLQENEQNLQRMEDQTEQNDDSESYSEEEDEEQAKEAEAMAKPLVSVRSDETKQQINTSFQQQQSHPAPSAFISSSSSSHHAPAADASESLLDESAVDHSASSWDTSVSSSLGDSSFVGSPLPLSSSAAAPAAASSLFGQHASVRSCARNVQFRLDAAMSRFHAQVMPPPAPVDAPNSQQQQHDAALKRVEDMVQQLLAAQKHASAPPPPAVAVATAPAPFAPPMPNSLAHLPLVAQQAVKAALRAAALSQQVNAQLTSRGPVVNGPVATSSSSSSRGTNQPRGQSLNLSGSSRRPSVIVAPVRPPIPILALPQQHQQPPQSQQRPQHVAASSAAVSTRTQVPVPTSVPVSVDAATSTRSLVLASFHSSSHSMRPAPVTSSGAGDAPSERAVIVEDAASTRRSHSHSSRSSAPALDAHTARPRSAACGNNAAVSVSELSSRQSSATPAMEVAAAAATPPNDISPHFHSQRAESQQHSSPSDRASPSAVASVPRPSSSSAELQCHEMLELIQKQQERIQQQQQLIRQQQQQPQPPPPPPPSAPHPLSSLASLPSFAFAPLPQTQHAWLLHPPALQGLAPSPSCSSSSSSSMLDSRPPIRGMFAASAAARASFMQQLLPAPQLIQPPARLEAPRWSALATEEEEEHKQAHWPNNEAMRSPPPPPLQTTQRDEGGWTIQPPAPVAEPHGQVQPRQLQPPRPSWKPTALPAADAASAAVHVASYSRLTHTLDESAKRRQQIERMIGQMR